MNILLVHNFYQQPGGEDQVFADEAALLSAHGHAVEQFTVHNSAVDAMGRIELARKTIWNSQSADTLREAIRRTHAEVVHFHNTFPLVSPAAYSAAKAEGASVIQTLHNYRLMCPAATLYREGHVCEDCVNRAVPWPALVHACYRGNRSATAAVAVMLTVHGLRGTYHKDVDAFIALTEFSKSKFIEAGFPADLLHVKQNFVDPDPGIGTGSGGYAIFVGRLTEEKGVRTLLKAWEAIGNRLPLKILGDGPLRTEVEATAGRWAGIEYLGRKPSAEIYELMGDARLLVFPSVWYEGLPRTIVESFAKGTPVLASQLGSMAELVKPGHNGELFAPGDADALIEAIEKIVSNPDSWAQKRLGARQSFEGKYTAGQNYPALMSVYDLALHRVRSDAGSAARETIRQGSPTAARSQSVS